MPYPAPTDPIAWNVGPTDARRILSEKVPVYFYLGGTGGASVTAFRAATNTVKTDREYVRVIEIVAPDARQYLTPAELAAGVFALVTDAYNTHNTNFPSLPFAWALELIGVPGAYNWDSPGAFPCLHGNADDMPAGMITSDKFVPDPRNGYGGISWTIASSPDASTVVVNAAGIASMQRFPSGWFNDYKPYLLIGAEAKLVQSIDETTGTITMAEPFTVARTGTCTYFRESNADNIWYIPSPFFTSGKANVLAWVELLVAALIDEFAGSSIPAPEALIFGEETWTRGWYATGFVFGQSAVDIPYRQFLEMPQATDPSETIDGTSTLAQWDAMYRPWVTDPTSWTNTANPANADYREYGRITFGIAYQRALEEALFAPFRSIWPNAIIGQYSLGTDFGTPAKPFRGEFPGNNHSIQGFGQRTIGKWAGPSTNMPMAAPPYALLQLRPTASGGSPTSVFTDWDTNGIGWDILPAWLELYGQPQTKAGIIAATSNHVSSLAQAIASVFPDRSKAFFVAFSNTYDGSGDVLSADYTYNGSVQPSITMDDGFYSPTTWAQAFFARMIEQGCNHIIFYAADNYTGLKDEYTTALDELETVVAEAWSRLSQMSSWRSRETRNRFLR